MKFLPKKISSNKAFKRIKQSTATKLLSGISVAALILVFAMLFWNRGASNQYDVVLKEKEALLANIDSFEHISAHLTQEARTYAATGNKLHYDIYIKELETDKTRELVVADMRTIGIAQGEEALISEMFALSNALVPIENEAIGLASQGKIEEAVALLFGDEYEAGELRIQEIADEFRKLVSERKQLELEEKNVVIETSFSATFICLIIVAIIQLIIIYYVTRRIIAPLLIIKDNMLEMAQGNLGENEEKLDADDDVTEIGQLNLAMKSTRERTALIIDDIRYVLGELADGNFAVSSNRTDSYIRDYEPILNAMRALKQKQNNTLIQIDSSADQVSNGSEQVSSGAQALAQGATEQASSVEELSAAITDISKKIETNTKLVVNATQLVGDTGDVVSAGNKKMDEMVLAMKEISEKSGQISNIIKTIDDIAFQTNILALNAAVEAARAGSAGKGFAVVADEVRNLASKSANAAKDTTDLIEDSISAVEKGAHLADETAEHLQLVSTNAEEIVRIINEIRTESEMQSDGLKQIAIGVEQISSVVQTNSATAEESAAASEELSRQATMLKGLVSEFHLDKSNAGKI